LRGSRRATTAVIVGQNAEPLAQQGQITTFVRVCPDSFPGVSLMAGHWWLYAPRMTRDHIRQVVMVDILASRRLSDLSLIADKPAL
jgi:hypothetical protein